MFLEWQLVLADRAAPFGLRDFKAALRYPLQEVSHNLGLALIFGALLFAVPYLGISRIGLFFAIAGVIPALVATVLLFGCDLRIINSVEAGRLDGKLLDASEMLADLGGTAALGCGILIVSFAPYLLSLRFAPNLSFAVWFGFGWMLFYYPLSLTVAAATNSFWETINPLNGLEVIQTHTAAFPKFLFFYSLISVALGILVVTVLVKLLQSISGIPLFALLPIFIAVMMVLGALVFYANLVIAYLLGRMQFKQI